MGITKDANKAELVLFQKNILDYVSQYNIYGSSRTESLMIPAPYTEICFVDKSLIPSDPGTSNKLFNSMAQNDENNNIFLLKDISDAKPLGFSDKIKVDGGFVCIKTVGSKLNIKFEGLGDSTKIVDPN